MVAPILAGVVVTAWSAAAAILFFAAAVLVSALTATFSNGIRRAGAAVRR